MPSKIEIEINKLQAHTEHLLDGFITLRENYAMLRPMLHNKSVVSKRGSKKHYRGFIIIRNTLFLSCCQMIANLSFDKNKQCPSIFQLIQKLKNIKLRAQLKESYTIWTPPSIGSHDLESLQTLKMMEEHDQIIRAEEFEQQYLNLLNSWYQFSNSTPAKSIEKIRKKVAAHTDISLIKGKYTPFDIQSLDLKWDEIFTTIGEIQNLIDLLNSLIRNSSYYWEELDRLIDETVNNYWGIPHTP